MTTIVESSVWHQKWKDARNKGIDGFIVGFKPGTHPGPITFDFLCFRCKTAVIATNVSESYEEWFWRHYKQNKTLDFMICDVCVSKVANEKLTQLLKDNKDI